MISLSPLSFSFQAKGVVAVSAKEGTEETTPHQYNDYRSHQGSTISQADAKSHPNRRLSHL